MADYVSKYAQGLRLKATNYRYHHQGRYGRGKFSCRSWAREMRAGMDAGEVRIGVTGHRFLVDLERLRTGVNTALDRIQQRFSGTRYTVLSSLAEGADRLIAQEALTRKMSLFVLLPFEKAEYMKDFLTRDSKREFARLLESSKEVIKMPRQETRAGSYDATGQHLLHHCDVLLAIWDGRPGQGIGGTGFIVEGARRLALPIAWVHAGNRQAGTTVPTSLGEEQGRVSFESFDTGTAASTTPSARVTTNVANRRGHTTRRKTSTTRSG